jgi:DNA-binding NtrC family response regulator
MLTDRISILAVSPREEDHRSLEAILRRSNWALHTASTIAEALRLVQTTVVSVIVSERYLPDGSWKDLLKSMEAGGFPQRVIVISAIADDSLWCEVLNLGGFDLLLKPLEPFELFRVASLANRSWREQARTESKSPLVATTAA